MLSMIVIASWVVGGCLCFFLVRNAMQGEFPARMHKSKNLRELSARWACKRIAIVPWHPFSGISLQFRGVAL